MGFSLAAISGNTAIMYDENQTGYINVQYSKVSHTDDSEGNGTKKESSKWDQLIEKLDTESDYDIGS